MKEIYRANKRAEILQTPLHFYRGLHFSKRKNGRPLFCTPNCNDF
uniref:Uncharacterized protein n=1 Tax=Siphoviridae sp. cthHz3 TaxID=2825614 RepID=A0A8S5UYI7_9CAUD|nr:MAG TPA: hypothetical protein [Siphoviridae sp. cthHz3]